MNKIELKECKKHGKTDYVLRADGRYRCKKCAVESVMLRRENIKKKALQYKGGKCERCGYDKCERALAFHHLDPTQKEYTLSRSNISWDKVKKELDKCILVCCNCHMELHDEIEKNKKLS
jgi:hypothetical protein